MSYYLFQENKISNVLIVGFGKTGKSIYKFLSEFYSLNIQISNNDTEFVKYELLSFDMIAVSPGIPINKPPYNSLMLHEIKIVSDIDLYYDHLKSINSKTKLVAVTGSNGKSTIVTMLNHVLTDLGYKSVLTGNIGESPLESLNDKYDFCIIEISSFQIDLLSITRFDLGCITNISPDHLDRYDSYDSYKKSKLNLDKFCHKMLIYDVDGSGYKYDSVYRVDGELLLKNECEILRLSQTYLFGSHNLENIIVTLGLFDILGVSIDKSILSIKQFKGLEHRCSLVGIVDGVTYINDSKGTNVGATKAALSSVTSSKNIIILLGGVAKGGDFTLMFDELSKFVKFAYIYGEDKMYIHKQICGVFDYVICNNMTDAMTLAHNKSQKNDIVLLSPACASFDEFNSYTERGNVFENFVNNQKNVK